MRKTYRNRAVCVAVFAVLFTSLFWLTTQIFSYKSLTPPWDMTNKVNGFYNQDANTNEVVFFGSSHMYCSVDPVLLEELTGMQSYVFSTQQQPLWVTYYYMEEALCTQNPQIMVVEMHMIAQTLDYYDDGTNHAAIDSMQGIANKLGAIDAAVTADLRNEYWFTLIKYHSRWEELTAVDFDLSFLQATDPLRGHVALDDCLGYDEQTLDAPWEVTEILEPTEKSLLYLQKMVDLCAKHEIELIFIKAPTNATAEETMYYNYMEDFAVQNEVTFYNFNNIDCGLEYEDFYDRRHLNTSGVNKFMPVLIQTLWGDDYNRET